ncbi:UTP--glucose-1-phosphate uridylyltransferase [bacterium]|nr:UTP--glucose-1-phosphate uridylyltransferase [bacterium]
MLKKKSVKKAIIPVAGLGTRFLPLSKILPKELFPLVDKPVLQYIIEEALNSGIKEIIFVSREGKEMISEYFAGDNGALKEILKARKKDKILKELKDFEKIPQNISFSHYISFSEVFQEEPLGDGHAILQAKEEIKEEPVAVLFGDDVVISKVPCLKQLMKVFEKYQCPIISLYRVPKKRISSYGVVKAKKLENRIYKIKEIIEKPPAKRAPSNLAIVGKYILTPEIFKYLQKAKPSQKGEIILAECLEKMLKDGKEVLGYEFEGKWLECGDKEKWLKSHLYLTLKHPQFGKILKKELKKLT